MYFFVVYFFLVFQSAIISSVFLFGIILFGKMDICASYKEKIWIYKPYMLFNVSHSDTDVFEMSGLYAHLYLYEIHFYIHIVLTDQF